ncbi:alpha/beta hydrolase family protein [candidate division KSB1 bacterium]
MKNDNIRIKQIFMSILFVIILLYFFPVFGQDVEQRKNQLYVSKDPNDHPNANYERHMIQKAQHDSIFEAATLGIMDYEKTKFMSRIGDLEIPAYVFQPLEKRGENGHAALVWIHGGVHGNLSATTYFPFIKEAIERGYIVVAPEYRGSTGYGKEFHEAIDYGGYEVDDCISAVNYIKQTMPYVDPDRIAMIGWSHGGFITLHSLFREPTMFKCGVAHVPVTNLVFRLSYKGPGYQRSFATQQRIQGLPFEQRDIYIERSPVYHVDKLQVPVQVHLATNDRDVNFVEAEMLVNALIVKKPELAETRIYVDPPGGHSFNRRTNRETLERNDSKEQRDSWNRIWSFLEWNLRPYQDNSKN